MISGVEYIRVRDYAELSNNLRVWEDGDTQFQPPLTPLRNYTLIVQVIIVLSCHATKRNSDV